jgi:hypothetical protein
MRKAGRRKLKKELGAFVDIMLATTMFLKALCRHLQITQALTIQRRGRHHSC